MTLEPETDHDRQMLEDLVRSARAAGYAEAVRDMSQFIVSISHVKDNTKLLSSLAKGIDALIVKGPSNA